MSYLEIILPFGIPPAAMAKQLLQQSQAPSLAYLLSYAKRMETMRLSEFARLLPHEYWLYARDENSSRPRQAKIDERYSSPAIAQSLMKSFGLDAQLSADERAFWFVLQPVHIHVARDHLVLTDVSRLQIDGPEARTLFDIAEQICQEYGFHLVFGDAQTWFLRADAWRDLQTSSIHAAAGHNMDIWMAEGEHARAWRKLQNEIQMAWHGNSINEAREARGLVAINSVWIHGGSDAPQGIQMAQGSDTLNATLKKISGSNEANIILLDELLEPALNSDWGYWLERLHSLEHSCFQPLRQALEEKHLNSFTLVLSDAQHIEAFECRKPNWLQAFKKPSLNRLQELVVTE